MLFTEPAMAFFCDTCNSMQLATIVLLQNLCMVTRYTCKNPPSNDNRQANIVVDSLNCSQKMTYLTDLALIMNTPPTCQILLAGKGQQKSYL